MTDTDYKDLVDIWDRQEADDAHGLRSVGEALVGALEAMTEERDALRAQLDSMATETRRATRGHYYTDDYQIIQEQRLVGPWVEATD